MKNYYKYGLMTGFYFCLYNYLLFLTGVSSSPSTAASVFSFMSFMIPVVLFAIGLSKIHKEDLGGNITIMSSIKYGMIMVWIAAAINVAYFYLYFNFLNPEYVQLQSDLIRESMTADGKTIEEITEMVRRSEIAFGGIIKYFTAAGSLFFIGILITPIYGILAEK